MEKELRHLELGDHEENDRYTLTYVYLNGESRMWTTFVTQRKAIDESLKLAKQLKIPVYNKMVDKRR